MALITHYCRASAFLLEFHSIWALNSVNFVSAISSSCRFDTCLVYLVVPYLYSRQNVGLISHSACADYINVRLYKSSTYA